MFPAAHCLRKYSGFNSATNLNNRHGQRLARRVGTVLLVLCLVCSSTPAAPATVVALTRESGIGFMFWLRASGLSKLIQGTNDPRPQETQEDRNARVTRLQIFPGDLTLRLDDRIQLTAIGYDPAGTSVGGVKIRLEGADDRRKFSRSCFAKRRIRGDEPRCVQGDRRGRWPPNGSDHYRA
jgi:hypothetical protein